VGLWSLVTGFGRKNRHARIARRSIKSEIRQLQAGRYCRFEAMEERRLLDADPIKIGVTYLEDDSGHDNAGDTFQVSFQGGAPGTELTHLEINGDHYAPGISYGDMIFDTTAGGIGVDGAFPVQVISSTGIGSVSWHVDDGSSLLKFDFQGFTAGEKLIFTVDVDEVQQLDPGVTDINTINQGLDPIASGVEFQGSHMTADFHAPHYYDIGGTSEFMNHYDSQFTGSTLLISQGNSNGLPNDDFQGQGDRSTGTMLQLQQVPLPVSIAGRVFADNNRNLVQDGSDFGLANVSLALWKKTSGTWSFTGHTTTTNGQGDYEFGTDLNLQPGDYEVRETQPAGYFSVGAIPGTVDGSTVGSTVSGNLDVLTEINLPLGDEHGIHYNFAEAQPASLRGHVEITDRNGDCSTDNPDAVTTPLANVKITLKDNQGNIIATTFTGTDGNYDFEGLMPGTYSVTEETPPGLLDADSDVGTISGIQVGVSTDPNNITSIVLNGGQNGINYDFCEHLPSSVSGYVYHDANNDGVRENGETPIPGTTVILLDASGTQVATTTTDNNGFYKFQNLSAGTYRIHEVQPSGWLDGKDVAGTIVGQVVGSAQNPGDQINGVTLLWGDNGVDYDFGELLPASIEGHVHENPTGDCSGGNDEGEKPIAGVTIQLLDQSGKLIATTTTDTNGNYEFTNLPPGVYAVHELQPAGYMQGDQNAGSGGGDDSVTDYISQVPIHSGDALVDYDFCEVKPVTISGLVWLDTIRNCEIDDGEARLGGVTIQLFNSSGAIIATTKTASDGTYSFTNLRPGTYNVHEVQPAGYFEGCTHSGSLGGDDSVQDDITEIVTVSGDNGINYNFSEVPAGSISGVVFRDGPPLVTQNGEVPDNLYQLRDGILRSGDLRIAGVTLELRYTLSGEVVRGEDLLPGTHPAGPVRTVTDGSGFYQFTGLPQGNYSVFEVQPNGYIDSLDTAGTTGGVAVNIGTFISPLMIQTFAAAGVSFHNDAILQVPLGVGQQSVQNNFSEVQVVSSIVPPPPETPAPPPPIHIPAILPVAPPQPPPQVFIAPAAQPEAIGGGGEFSWHLSIIDAGLPRVAQRSTRQNNGLVFRSALWIEKTEWQPERLRDGVWLVHGASDAAPHALFGLPGATPIVGDFNGDGKDEIAIFHKGEWFVDLNGNGQWDADDLWCKLGSDQDRPVSGDWDGDGKEDIGIFGPQWPGDPVHLEHEAGLPDQDNQRMVKLRAKNVPPNPEEATDGERLLRLTSQGKERADLIDHVFQFGGNNDIPIAGDWNGDGIRSVGVYRDGKWHFDMDGDGRWSDGDKTAQFGQKGDLPVVGDFNGDGIEEIAVFRDGKWIIDSNGNREIDAGDRVIQFGQAGDKPIAGDFDGDGTDEPAVFRPS
jgi:serine-aspartate repeat-containing protein C/D/E